ncbi:MAG TPA: DUF6174 domain-containing protein [Gemmatimonadaceae bacterium]|nr:DUF6174 domain-containing protein [Gemmatimonadaceae bacterium]
MKPVRILLLLVATLLAGAGCPTEPVEVDELVAARRRWTAEGPRAYAFDYARNCFCLAETTRPVTIHVRAGVVEAVFDRLTGQRVTIDPRFPPWPTIPQLFDEVARAAREADDFRVAYDARLGFPVDFFADWIERAADDESGFTAANVRPLP